MGNHNNQSHGNDTQCQKEQPLLLALGGREYCVVELRPLARTLQQSRTRCRSAGVCHLGHYRVEAKKPLGMRGVSSGRLGVGFKRTLAFCTLFEA